LLLGLFLGLLGSFLSHIFSLFLGLFLDIFLIYIFSLILGLLLDSFLLIFWIFVWGSFLPNSEFVSSCYLVVA
jgi:hypothetical protein